MSSIHDDFLRLGFKTDSPVYVPCMCLGNKLETLEFDFAALLILLF